MNASTDPPRAPIRDQRPRFDCELGHTWKTHVRGLIGHLVLGAAIEAAFDIVDLAADLT